MVKHEWSVEIPSNIVANLIESFNLGPIITEPGVRCLNEDFVAQIKSLKISIFAKEHPPPHFRVACNGEEANYTIKDCSQLNGDLKKWYKNIKQWHGVNKSILIDTWNNTRPSNCPVGRYCE